MAEHGGNIEKALIQYRLSAKKVIDFSANINPLGIPSHIIQKTICKALYYADRYPDPEYTDLRKELSSWYGVQPQNILPDNGSVSLIYLIPRALGLKRTLIPIPAFSEYEKSVCLAGGRPLFLKPLKDFSLDIDALLKQLKGSDSLYIGNPSNPTGLLIAKDDLTRIIKDAKAKNITVIIDEAFIEFTENHKKDTFIKEAPRSGNLIVIRSMTKYFAMAGLRLGMAIARQEIIARLKKFQPPWPVNSVAMSAAIEFIKDKKYISDSFILMRDERNFLYTSLAAFTWLETWQPSANFIFCKIRDGRMTAATLRDRLAKKGTLIRDCSNFRGLDSSFFRVAVRTRPENEKLIRGLALGCNIQKLML